MTMLLWNSQKNSAFAFALVAEKYVNKAVLFKECCLQSQEEMRCGFLEPTVLQDVAHMNITKKMINGLSRGYPSLVLAQYLSV